MCKIFFISDLHFGHGNIIKYENRPFKSIKEMDEQMILNWNNTVTPNDRVYILGDFCFGSKYDALSILDRLNGEKFIIRGNHDHVLSDKEVYNRFKWVKDYYVLKHNGLKIVLFHYPIQVFDCQHHGAIHLYGHIHSDKENHHPMVCSIKNAYNVGADVNNFRPISLEEILIKLNYNK